MARHACVLRQFQLRIGAGSSRNHTANTNEFVLMNSSQNLNAVQYGQLHDAYVDFSHDVLVTWKVVRRKYQLRGNLVENPAETQFILLFTELTL